MIFVDRNRIKKPAFFFSKEYDESVKELFNFYENTERSQKRFLDFYLPTSVTNSLEQLFNGKCAYCESHIDKEIKFKSKAQFVQKKMPNLKMNAISPNLEFVDNFRPRNNAKGYNTKGTDLEHYWWLSYNWQNLFYCCNDCKSLKGNWFPIEGKRASIKVGISTIDNEENSLLLNPCIDDLENQFSFNFVTGEIIGNTIKANAMIDLLKLNRSKLLYNRKLAIEEEDKIFKKYLLQSKNKRIDEKLSSHWKSIIEEKSSLNYVAFRKKAILSFFKNRPNELSGLTKIIPSLDALIKPSKIETLAPASNLEELIFDKVTGTEFKSTSKNIEVKKESFKVPTLKNIYITKIELRNYKCFNRLTIKFLKNNNVDREPWLVFLGENGVGKSSILKAIAVALMGQKNIDKHAIKASKFLQYGRTRGHIKLFGLHGEVFEVKFDEKKIVSNIKNPPSYLIGYGSTRLLPKGNLQPENDVKYVKIKNLFDYSIALYDAKSWLINAEEEMFNQAAKSLKDLLLLSNDDLIVRNINIGELYIKYAKSGNRIDVDELSDGYKTIFALTIDLIKTLSNDNLAFETAEGIVLIDEIGTHLHPRWKMEVVNRLRNAFPKLQFIATTHEPLCLRGLGENEVIVLKKNAQEKIIAISDLPSPNEFRVDQLLTSEYFGLNSTMDFETEDLFKEYYYLIAKESGKLNSNEEKRIEELSQLLPKKTHLGDDIRDELVYYVIDELLAKQVSDDGYKIINDEIKQKAIEKVKTLWKHISSNNNML